MSKHFDELNSLLSLLQCNFSVIGISETRILKGQEPLIFQYQVPHVSKLLLNLLREVFSYISQILLLIPRPDLNLIFNLPKTLRISLR